MHDLFVDLGFDIEPNAKNYTKSTRLTIIFRVDIKQHKRNLFIELMNNIFVMIYKNMHLVIHSS